MQHGDIPAISGSAGPAVPALPAALPVREGSPFAPLISFLRWCGAIAGTVAIIAALVVAGVYIIALTRIEQDAREALIAIAASCAAGVIAMLVLYVSARPYAKICSALLALTLISGGLAMMVVAPVVRQMDAPHIVEYRGFNALMLFGATATALGVALAALCVHWSLRPSARRTIAGWARIAGSAYGVLLSLIGLSATLGLLALVNASETADESGIKFSVVEQAIAVTALAAWFLVPGLLLTYHGISASMGEGSSEFRPPVPLIGLLVFAAVVTLGQLNMRAESPAAWPMPVLHTIAAAIPGVTLALMAARATPLLRGIAVRGVTWRQVTLAAAISMSVATMIAVYVESIGAYYAIVLLLVHNGAFADAANATDARQIIDAADIYLTENEQFVAGLITAAVLAPLSEEFAKSLGPRFMMRGDSTRAQAFFLGACAGAGFGFLEALLYGLAGIGDDLGNWWAIMTVRGGSTSLHVLCTGLAGLGWWYWSIGRRHRVALTLFAVAMLIHAGWNGVFTIIESRILVLDTLTDRTLEIIAYTIVAVVSAAMVLAIPLIARRLREVPPPVEGTPLAGMSPWLA